MKNPVKSSDQGKDSFDKSIDETIQLSATLSDVPGYQVQRELGRGAMAVVYEAEQVKLKRSVALKMIGAVESASGLSRFQAEAEAVARLQHRNIVQIFDVGECQGRPYLALELADGGTLEDLMSQSSHSVREVAEAIEKLARAMHYAHQHEIIHRDLKPSNVLVTSDGELKVSDFGLAKQLDNDSSQTQLGEIMGTPHYMSPEQAVGDEHIGPATDIYALGAMLYDFLTGQPPFHGDTTLATLEKIRNRDPQSPRRLNPKLHPDLETVCLKCLQKQPRHRYESAESLADDLRRFLDGEPVIARPISVWEQLWRKAKRRPAVSSLAVVLVVTVTVGVWVLAGLSRQASESQELVEATQKDLAQAKVREQQLVADRALELEVPAGLRPVNVPSDNPLTVARVELGKLLFFDKRLSLDNSVACASCHNPVTGWSNGEPLATGVGGQQGGRNSPTIVNAAQQRLFFWDGRAASLEEQAVGPILNPIEMGMPSLEVLADKLNKIAGYEERFQLVFGTPANGQNIAKAIASFERTIMSGGAPIDTYKAGDDEALSTAAARGRRLFFNKAHCSACHAGGNFTDGAFHNIGIGVLAERPDPGREAISELVGDRASFKTPTLREIARTAPYMHDGSLLTLEDVIDYYDRGGTANPQLDEEILPLGLSPQEKRDLVTFLKEGLSSPQYPFVELPELPK